MKNTNKSYGNNSTNIGKAMKVEINHHSKDYQEVSYEKNTVRSAAIKPRRIKLTGLFGVGASIISYLSLFLKFPIFELPREIVLLICFVLALSIVFFAFGGILETRRYIYLFNRLSIEADDKKVFLKRTKVHCPQCNSELRVYQNKFGVFARCERSPQHHFTFDYTTFTDNR